MKILATKTSIFLFLASLSSFLRKSSAFTPSISNVINNANNWNMIQNDEAAKASYNSVIQSYNEMTNFREFPETLTSNSYLTCQNEIQDYMGLALKLSDFENYWQDMLFLHAFRYTNEMHLFRYVNAYSMCVKKSANDGRSKIIEDEFYSSFKKFFFFSQKIIFSFKKSKLKFANALYDSMINTVKYHSRLNLDFSSYAIQKNSLAAEEFVYFDRNFYVGLKFDYHAMAQEYTIGRIPVPVVSKNDNEIALEINSILDTRFQTYNPEYIEYEDSQRKKYWYGSINDLWRLNQRYTDIYKTVGLSRDDIEDRIEAEYQFMRISDNYLPEIRHMEVTLSSTKLTASVSFMFVLSLFLSN